MVRRGGHALSLTDHERVGTGSMAALGSAASRASAGFQ
jgi:hypothetical protein